jgi:hypothetical protein
VVGIDMDLIAKLILVASSEPGRKWGS